jgi:catechol 2,3-dioxygenase-like lactoylglutathione lyase family enzyme
MPLTPYAGVKCLPIQEEKPLANEITIPALPCRSINETLEFYVALGFEITYQQSRPNTYACVKHQDIELHFFTMRGYEPKDSYSTCIVLVPDLAGLHQTFSSGLRSHYGKLPVAGIPRISKLNNSNADKQLRFNVIDPGGNWVRFIQKGEQPAVSDAAPQKDSQSKLARATHAADWVIEAEGDYERAAKVLDKGLAEAEAASPVERVGALVLRAGIAYAMDDAPLAERLLSEVRQIPLDDSQRTALDAELQRATDLEAMLS